MFIKSKKTSYKLQISLNFSIARAKIMFTMGLFERLLIGFIFFGILTVIGQNLVLSHPVTTDIRSNLEAQSRFMKEYALANVHFKDDICTNKGKFCEIICKNNPSEGGKMCK